MSKPSTVPDLILEAANFALKDWGDENEQQSADFLAQQMPGYQEFWRVFVFPFRVSGSIWIQGDLIPSHEAVCIHNYSLFRAAARAFKFLEEARRRHAAFGEVGSDHFYDFCIWLDIAYERAAQLCGALHFYLCAPADTQRRSLKAWDKHAPSLNPFLGTDIRQRVQTAAREVRWYRNRIAHGPKFPGAADRVPRKDDLDDLLYWSNWKRTAEGSREEWLKRTTPRLDLITQMWREFSALNNEFLERVIAQTRVLLARLPDHDMVELPDLAALAKRPDGSVPTPPGLEILPSGVLGGSR